MSGKIKTKEEKEEEIKGVFKDLNRKFQEQEAERRARTAKLSYFDLRNFPIDENNLVLVPEQEARDAGAVPFYRDGQTLKLGLVDPANPALIQLMANLGKAGYQIEEYLVSSSGLEYALSQYRRVMTVAPARNKDIMIHENPNALEDVKLLGKSDKARETTELLSLILEGAMIAGSSDIHLEPEKSIVNIRFRIDGVLQDIGNLTLPVYAHLLSRIKLAAYMKLNVTNVPQDGRFTAIKNGKPADLRVSILPSAFGESVVMRILGTEGISVEMEKLGLSDRDFEMLKRELDKPNGMILTTGPTGSGKTTTLYAFLRYLNSGGVKIITLEDPVEYKIESITQTPIDHAAGMDFAKGLRSILRQDPDIVMVGEIRDFETAETAAQAALTGHVVLSTLHTNDAAGAIPRLLDLGVKAVTLAPALNALIAQRLLRKICQECKEIYKPNQTELERVKQSLATLPKDKSPKNFVFYRGPGCKTCHNIGYKGRIGVFEVFAVDGQIEKLIYEGASSQEIRKAAVAAGMTTMQQDGILKAISGLTDLAEVWRATEE